jgi:hypothetical protein
MIWLMAKPSQPYPTSQHVLKSKVFFTTFEHAEIPDSPIKLFLPCIQQLEEEWNSICDTAEAHLSNMVCPLNHPTVYVSITSADHRS